MAITRSGWLVLAVCAGGVAAMAGTCALFLKFATREQPSAPAVAPSRDAGSGPIPVTPEGPSAPAPTPAPTESHHIGQTYRARAGFFACLTKEQYKEFLGYVMSKDEGAARKAVSAGSCIILKPGLELVYLDYDWGLAKVRPRGETITFYTAIEALVE